jgi:hypothetical protein
MSLGLWQFPLALQFTFRFLASHYFVSLPADPLHFVIMIRHSLTDLRVFSSDIWAEF